MAYRERQGDPWRQAAIIVAVYVVVAGTYIVLSDRVVEALVTDTVRLTRLQTAKGWAFVVATAAMLWLLIGAALARRRALEREAEASRERYRLLFEAISDAVFVHALDADGRPGATIEVNQAACDQLGWSRAELLARTMVDLAGPDTCARLPELFARLQREGHLVVEAEHRHRDGRLIPVEAHVRLAQIDDRRVALVIARDISERRRVQEELVRSERLAAVGVLASGLAHEFNNLHAAVLGQIELALLDPAIGEAPRTRLELAMTTIERAGGLTRNLLAVGRRGGGERVACDPRQAVAETMGMLRGQLTSDGVAVELALGAVPTVLADRAQLGQVVMNLVINAWHALEGRPVRRIEVRTATVDGEAVITVADTGCGIAPEHRERLFIPFFTTKGARAEQDSVQAKHVGTGLGLSVSRAIVAAHGGRIEVDSEPGRGSVFTIHLPAHAGELAPKPSAPAPLAPMRILVLDDEPMVREVVSAGLCSEGHRVHATDDGEDALARHAEEPFAIALIDLQMPKMSGPAFALRLRAASGQVPRVIAMTGRLEGDGTLPEGIDDVLIKPFPLPELRRHIAAAMRR